MYRGRAGKGQKEGEREKEGKRDRTSNRKPDPARVRKMARKKDGSYEDVSS